MSSNRRIPGARTTEVRNDHDVSNTYIEISIMTWAGVEGFVLC